LIECRRNGKTIDQGFVKKVVDSSDLLGLDEKDINKVSLDVYKGHLETPFLDATKKYYEYKSEPFHAGSSVRVSEKGEERLKEEDDRVVRYLNPDTRELLVYVLIQQYFNLKSESSQIPPDFDREEDLQTIYAFLSRVPEALGPLRKKFEEHGKNVGLTAVAQLLDEGSGVQIHWIRRHTSTNYLTFIARTWKSSRGTLGERLGSLSHSIRRAGNSSIAMLQPSRRRQSYQNG
jgi:cullin 1